MQWLTSRKSPCIDIFRGRLIHIIWSDDEFLQLTLKKIVYWVKLLRVGCVHVTALHKQTNRCKKQISLLQNEERQRRLVALDCRMIQCNRPCSVHASLLEGKLAVAALNYLKDQQTLLPPMSPRRGRRRAGALMLEITAEKIGCCDFRI